MDLPKTVYSCLWEEVWRKRRCLGRGGGGEGWGASTVVDLYTCVMRNVQLLVLLIAFIISFSTVLCKVTE